MIRVTSNLPAAISDTDSYLDCSDQPPDALLTFGSPEVDGGVSLADSCGCLVRVCSSRFVLAAGNSMMTVLCSIPRLELPPFGDLM